MKIAKEVKTVLKKLKNKNIIITGLTSSGKTTLKEQLEKEYPNNTYFDYHGTSKEVIFRRRMHNDTQVYDYILEIHRLPDGSRVIKNVSKVITDQVEPILNYVVDDFYKNSNREVVKMFGHYEKKV